MSGLASPATGQLQRSLEVTLTAGERRDIAWTIGLGLFAGGVFTIGFGLQQWGPPERRLIAACLQALAAVLVILPTGMRALVGLLRGDAASRVDQLAALAALAAFAIGDFTTATLIPLIMQLGHFLEERSVMGAQAAVQGLRQLQRRRATQLVDGVEREVEATALQTGDVLLVRPGDLFAADGEVLDGTSAVDQSSMTGESVPEDVSPGANVFAGTVNLTGRLLVRVLRTGSETTLGRVVDLLREAESTKTPLLKLIEQYAGVFLLVVLTLAAVVLFLTREVHRAIAVLVVGCPGPFILAGPTAMIAALAAATRQGILIKSTRLLESLADVDTVVFDKTGTLTVGELRVVGCHCHNGLDETQLLASAAACAEGSRHPVSRAILRESERRGSTPPDGFGEGEVRETTGLGVRRSADGQELYLGRRAYLESEGFTLPAEPPHAGALAWLGHKTAAKSGRPEVLGCVLLADEARAESPAALAGLRELLIDRTVLLTGDRRSVAEQLGRRLGIDAVIAEALPEQKLDAVRRERESGRTVMVVGDGTNDALALASGDVGVAMGSLGSDVALQSADVVLARSDLTRLPQAVLLARATRRTIHQNVLMGAAITLTMLALASSGVITPLAGAVLHNLGEVYVLVNSARLLRHRGG